MMRLRFILCFFLCCLSWAGHAHAQDLLSPKCLQRTYDELAHADRKMRSIALGQLSSADLPLESVRYNKQLVPWTKKERDVWNTIDRNLSGTTLDDLQMDGQAEFHARRGILSQTGALTSQDILPDMAQLLRAFQCHTRAICDLQRASQSMDAPNIIKVQPLGCIEYSLPRMSECALHQPVGGSNMTDTSYAFVSASVCNDVRNELIDYEENVLTMLTTYDATYRVFMQFAGTFQDLMTSFRVLFLTPLWQTVRVMNGFDSIPCFNGQCDEK